MLLKVSNTILFLILSSPLLTDSVNVPLALLTFEISHLKLSLEPSTNEPSLFCDISSMLEEVALLYISPFPIDSNWKGWILALLEAEINVEEAAVKEPVTTLATNKLFPPWEK